MGAKHIPLLYEEGTLSHIQKYPRPTDAFTVLPVAVILQ